MQLEFITDVVKSVEAEGKLIIEGVAATTDVDKQRDQMSPQALLEMSKSAVGVPITMRHSDEKGEQIGRVIEAHVSGKNLVIKAELNKDDLMAQRYYNLIKADPNDWKMSVNVIAKLTYGAGIRIVQGIEKFKHIALTSQPVNENTFVTALSKAMDEEEASLYKSVSTEERDKHATFFEEVNGKKVGKFPIFDEHSAESALHLIGHAPADKQELVRERACKILGDSHPACQLNKSSEDTMTKDEIKAAIAEGLAELNKAGAKFSTETIGALKDIHDNTNDTAVKSKVRAMLGDEAVNTLGPVDRTPEDTFDSVGVPDLPNLDNGDADDIHETGKDGIGIEKSISDVVAPVIDIEAIKAAVTSVVKDELAKARPETKGPVEEKVSTTVGLKPTEIQDKLLGILVGG